MTCADCGGTPRHMNESTLNKGSQVREPGEALCEGCSSRRLLMVRAVNRLPAKLDLIKALRAQPVGTK